MRVLYSHYLTSRDHPAAKMVQFIAAELEALGHSVQIHNCAGEWQENSSQTSPKKRGLQFIRDLLWFSKSIRNNRNMYPGDLEAIRNFQPDIVLSRQDAYCYSMAKACAKTKTPMVTYADAPVAYETRHFEAGKRWHPPFLVERIEKYGLKQSRGVITVSETAKSILNEFRLSIPIQVVPNGVNLSQFEILHDNEKLQLRRELGLDQQTILGFLGTFRPFHGLALLRELLAHTSAREDIHWLLIGDGPGRQSLQESFGKTKNISFVGRQPSERVGKLLQITDIAVVPYNPGNVKYYFCPLKLLECCAAGCAVLASPVGDIPNLISHNETGILIPDNNLLEWKVHLGQLLTNKEQMKKIGDQAREFITHHRTWHHTASSVARFLQQMLPET